MKFSVFKEILEKYLSGKASSQESDQVDNWYGRLDGPMPELDPEQKDALREELLGKLNSRIEETGAEAHAIRPARRRWLFPAAAALLIGLAAGFWVFNNGNRAPVPALSQTAPETDIQPGGHSAFLTLADGQVVDLKRLDTGMLAMASNVRVEKEQGGKLVYLNPSNMPAAATAYNTITIPRGGEFRVVLPDGTQVWMNSASTLTYPVHFSSDSREVRLSGEAYFEVAHDADRPFRIRAGDSKIEVLGTHFNVSAYPDEQEQQTTLLEGSVRISLDAGTQSQVLHPGEQATIGREKRIQVQKVNAAQAIAWTKGYFQFDRQGIQEIMTELSRWYNIEVTYTGTLSDDQYVGRIRREATLSQALKILKLSQVHVNVKGRQVIIGQKNN